MWTEAANGQPVSRTPARRPTGGLTARLSRWRRDVRGTSAVEFAFFAPVLFFGLLSMTDLGLAASERMTLDHILRAGAQRAMADPGEAAVLSALNVTAEKNFILATNNAQQAPNPVSLSVTRFCACPNQTGVAVACATICNGPKATYIYYRISGQKTYSGMLMPAITAAPSVQVQIR